MNEHLRTLFDQLNKNAVSYLLLTDFEGDLDSNDVDLYVSEEERPTFENLLQQNGWFKRKEPSKHLNHFFYYSPASDVYIDVKYSLSFVDGDAVCFEYKKTQKVFENVVYNHLGIKRPAGVDAVILYAAHLGYKERGHLEEKHRRYLTSYINLYQSEFTNEFLPAVNSITNWLKKDFPQNTYQLKKIIHPYFTYEYKRMTRENNYSKYGYGLKVLFLGTDGSGKTTLVHAVKNKLNLKTKELYLGMGKNGWTCRLTKHLYNYKPQVKLYDKAFNFLKTFLLLPLEFLFRIMPVKFKSKYSVVLIDRFPGSVFLNSKRASFLYNIILPKPDLVFFLYADPEVLKQRKPQEVTIERSKNDIKRFEKVAHVVSNGSYITIDTSKMSIPEARDVIISEIYKNKKVYDHLLTSKLN